MKAAANGVLNLSTLDGWWDEVWDDPENSHKIGWAIGKGEAYQDLNYQDQVEADALYDLLERDVVPTFYDRGADRIPRKWVDRMKTSIGSLCHFVNTHRMVSNYVERFYIPNHEHFRALADENANRGRALAAAMQRIRNEWRNVAVGKIEEAPSGSLAASPIRVRAHVQLGDLQAQDVVVELYLGRVDTRGEIIEGRAIEMRAEPNSGGDWVYVGETTPTESGLHGFTIRVRPSHPDLSAAFVPGLIVWANGGRASAARG
jgi:starch phosphorylase